MNLGLLSAKTLKDAKSITKMLEKGFQVWTSHGIIFDYQDETFFIRAFNPFDLDRELEIISLIGTETDDLSFSDLPKKSKLKSFTTSYNSIFELAIEILDVFSTNNENETIKGKLIKTEYEDGDGNSYLKIIDLPESEREDMSYFFAITRNTSDEILSSLLKNHLFFENGYAGKFDYKENTVVILKNNPSSLDEPNSFSGFAFSKERIKSIDELYRKRYLLHVIGQNQLNQLKSINYVDELDLISILKLLEIRLRLQEPIKEDEFETVKELGFRITRHYKHSFLFELEIF